MRLSFDMLSHILITSEYESYKISLINELGIKNLRFFEYDDLKVDSAKEIIKEAYLAEVQTKFIVIKASSFGIEAQNSLLKILEEPPRNIIFIIVANSKNSLLPTIKSRLMIKTLGDKKQRIKTELNFKKLSIRDISNFIDEKIGLEKVGELDRLALKELVQTITLEALEQGVRFDEGELEFINKLVYLCEFNAKAHSILSPLLLLIGEKK